ncbi:GDPmannose 4,6-dehydratase [Roseivirga ehrenbergii]|uniref:GDP-mannose 4,6-dehydratase n=1 Tax=Roseivirga ehrenbergii (strain DSM 102268 / JCM 13514 / KCTC 12282 / NCIMB 14502 / KMM 6017) TaxID=279360 RepID=A0A150XQS8_ROSEK|nr:GDP-mannose 4,6-dehydratase [Roseivirga ehrenbergii]KYG81118.1 GDP-mannose 4,6 dehydratase [Roseivirga ehrenbergii]TCL00894.1 GDPmannose 4,6-dehydratase [Roseivirga ehrenbergii]
MKTALISGITGQDGSYLAELLLQKGYIVHGIKRRSSSFNTERVDHLYHEPQFPDPKFTMHYGDLTDATNIIRIVQEVEPDEIYNLGAQSHVNVSFETPEYTANSDALGTLRMLEAIRILKMTDKARFYQASTSEIFGKVQQVPQNEQTPFHPRSPYGVAKLYAHWITINYREAYKMYTCSGILFNHESPRRGKTFVSRKVTRGVAEIHLGIRDCIYVGNLNAERDWGHAVDYARGMWLMLQQKTPDDYVLATGKQYSVRTLIEMAFSVLDESIEWHGSGLKEVGVLKNSGRIVVRIDKKYLRPSEVDSLIGDASKAKRELGWKPKISFEEMIREMVLNDKQQLEERLIQPIGKI